jgi:cytochrome c2
MRSKIIAAAALGVACVLLGGCTAGAQSPGVLATGGDPARGSAAIFKYGCGSCHTIGGIANARGLVGPPLTGIRNRMYVAGMLPNTAENIVSWIRNPKEFNPKTAMPVLGVTQQDADDIAAYLYSIK